MVLGHSIANKEQCDKDGKDHFELALTPIEPLAHDEKCDGEILSTPCYQKTKSVESFYAD